MALLNQPLATPLLAEAAVVVLASPVHGSVPVFVTGKLMCPKCHQPTGDLSQGVIIGSRTITGSFFPLQEDEPHPQSPRKSGPNQHAATPTAVCLSCQGVVRFPLDNPGPIRELADQAFLTVDPDGHAAYHNDAAAYLADLREATLTAPVTPASTNYCLDEPGGGDPSYMGEFD